MQRDIGVGIIDEAGWYLERWCGLVRVRKLYLIDQDEAARSAGEGGDRSRRENKS